MDPATVRHTLVGAAVGGALFGAVAIYRSLVAGGDLLAYAGPVGVFTVIGATVGGLVGPLLGRAVARRAGDGAGEGGGGEDGDGAESRQPPAWVHLLSGAAVGFGIGHAWGRVWVGVAVGVGLALLARRIFRS